MAGSSYVPGEWFGIVRSGTVVVLGPGTQVELVDSVWSLLEQSPGVHDVLNEVTGSFGVSLTRIPSFGIVDVKDSLRVFLRGDLELGVTFPSGEQNLHGREVTTWTERRLEVPQGYRLEIGSAGGLGTASFELPLAEGVVMLSALVVTVNSQSQSRSEPVAIDTVMGFQDDDPGLTIAPGQPFPGAVEPSNTVQPSNTGPLPAGPEPTDDGGAAAPEPVQAPSEVPVHTETTDELVQHVETTSSYDHLWEKTVIRNIEDAAVRLDPEAEEHELQLPAQEQDEPEPEPRTEPETPAEAERRDAVPASGSGLIDSVPWAKSSSSQGSPPQAAPPQTRLPSATGSAPAPLPGDGSGISDSPDGDHDGQTLMKSSLAELPVDLAAPERSTSSLSGPMVLAKVCQRGHANPPTYSHCAACGLALPGEGVQVPRPRLGRMRLSTGELVDLDQSLIIGRQPSVSKVQGGAMPRLVQVDSPGGDISRSHVEVRLEGWHVMLCDLKATNGTTLIREGQAPRRLAQNEMAILLDGDIAELGENISLRFEEIL